MAAHFSEYGTPASWSSSGGVVPWPDTGYWLDGSGYATEFPTTGIMRLDDWWWDDLGNSGFHPSNLVEPPFGFGAEGGGGGAPAGGAGGGGGMDAGGMGAMMQAIAAIVNGVFEGVALAKNTEAKPEIVAQTQSRMFNRRLQAIERLNAEVADLEARAADARRWLSDSSRKKQWMTGPQAMRSAPKGAKECPGLWEGAPTFRSPGGHAYGLPSCRCPSATCAFKDPAAAGSKKTIASGAKIERVKHTRDGGNTDWPKRVGHGNLDAYRTELRHSWGQLMGLKAFEPLLKMHPYGATVLTKIPPTNVLIGADSLTKIFPEDPDTAQGIVPFYVLNDHLGSWLNFAAMFPEISGFRPPIWMYGLTPEEQRQVGIGPTIGAVQKTLEARPSMSFAGYDTFGSAYGASSGVAGMIKSMLMTPQGRSQLAAAEAGHAASNPTATQLANSPAALAPPPASTIPAPGATPAWVPWAVLGGSVAVFGLAGLFVWALLR